MRYKNIFVEGVLSDIEVNNGIITSVEAVKEPEKIIASGVALHFAIPSLVNMHTHSAMTLLRSAGSGLPLFRWLNEAIFPEEAKLTPDDIYKGSLEACREMRSTGTTAFNDMYFSIGSTIRAARETGMSANIALSVTDTDFDNGNVKDFVNNFSRLSEQLAATPGITISIAPHAIYTVSARNLIYVADFAKEHNLLFHIHLSETQKERQDCIAQNGLPPVKYLDKLGILQKTGSRFIGAHSLWLDQEEINLLGAYHATVVHCPNSNLKLGSGSRFLYTELRDAGVNVTIGTDGCASSDNLDLIESLKVMSLLQKGNRNDPSVLPASEAFQVASANGRKALRLPDNSIRPNNVANFILVDINNRNFRYIDLVNSTSTQRHEAFLNRLLYSALGNAVTAVVSD